MATVNDGLRMVGQLLLHHSTTGSYGRDSKGKSVGWDSPKASCFCYWGAVSAVARCLDLRSTDLEEAGKKLFGQCIGGSDWDDASETSRLDWAGDLCKVKEP